MKIIMEFDPYEDREEWEIHTKAHKRAILEYEIENYLRQIDKHRDLSADQEILFDEIRDKWYEIKQDCEL